MLRPEVVGREHVEVAVDGVYDDDEKWPEPAFIRVGSIDEMKEKARSLSTGRFPRVL